MENFYLNWDFLFDGAFFKIAMNMPTPWPQNKVLV